MGCIWRAIPIPVSIRITISNARFTCSPDLGFCPADHNILELNYFNDNPGNYDPPYTLVGIFARTRFLFVSTMFLINARNAYLYAESPLGI